MAEPIPQQQPEVPKSPAIVVGETPIYLKEPMKVDGVDVSSLVIQSGDKRGASGINSSVLLVKEPSRRKGEEGKIIDKPVIHVDTMDEMSWDKISGVQWTDESGVAHMIPKDALSLEKPSADVPVTTEVTSTEIPATENAQSTEGAKVEAVTIETPTETTTVVTETVPQQTTEPSPAQTETPPSTETAGAQPNETTTEVAADSQAAETVAEAPVEPQEPKVKPSMAREVLSNLTEDPNTITIVGLRAYETRALDLADRAMQKLATPRMQERSNETKSLLEKTKDAVKNIEHFTVDTIWKQSVGGIYFHEKAREYYMDMLTASETPFAEEAIRLAEARATEAYNKKLADSNFIVRAGTKAVDWLKDTVGMRTTIQNMALAEIGVMKANGELQGAETFERESKAIRARFSQDMDKADQYVRTQLGEKLEILDASKEEHKPLVEGIQGLLKQYATGEIADRAEFDQRTKEFFNATLKNVRPDIFAEAELYSSSLFEAADMLRDKMSHEAGLANLDEALSGIQIRLGLGSMGEVTSLEPTAVERGISRVRGIYEWMQKNNVMVPMVFNEAAIGSGVAIALSALNLVKTMPARAMFSLGGGAIAGGAFAGWREYGQLQKDYLTHLREREVGTQFTESQKRRAWFEKFSVKQRSANEMMSTLQTALYEPSADGVTPGTLKTTLTDDELRATFATVADLQARKAVSETGPKQIGLVQYTSREAIESERAALDIVANKALSDIETYLTAHTEQAASVLGDNSFADFMVKLTTNQTQVLKQGITTLDSMEDPIRATLGLVSEYAPEAAIIKRRWPFAGNRLSDSDKALGMDAIVAEFNKEAVLEAVKYGVKAGVIGAAVGGAVHLASDLFAHTDAIKDAAHEATQKVKDAVADRTQPAEFTPGAGHTVEAPLSPVDPTHVVHIGNTDYQIPKEVTITAHETPINIHGNPDRVITTYDASVHLPNGDVRDITLGSKLSETQLRDVLGKTGLTIEDGHAAIPNASKVIDIPGLKSPYGNELMAQIPPGYTLEQSEGAWNLIDSKHELIAHGIRFNTDGSLSNIADVKPQLDAHHLSLDTSQSSVIHGVQTVTDRVPVSHEALPAVVPTEAAGSNMETLQAKELGNGGMWEYFSNKFHGDNAMAAANGEKNLFRMYTYSQHNANIIVPPESAHANFVQNNLRDAVYGSEHVKEIGGAIPNDATIQLPKDIFGAKAIEKFGEINDKAIAHYHDLISSGKSPMDAIHTLEAGTPDDKAEATVLRLGYIGTDRTLPPQSQVEDFYKYLHKAISTSGPETPAGAPPVSIPTTHEVPYSFTVHNVIIKEIPADAQPGKIFADKITVPYNLPSEVATAAREALEYPDWASRHAAEGALKTAELPWFPIIPIYHEALELAPMEVVSDVKPKPNETLYSPFGTEEAFLTKEAIAARTSPRLKENPAANLVQSDEIAWYLSQLSEPDRATLDELSAQITTPIAPDVRAVVTIPLSTASHAVSSRLSQYAAQTNADGSPLDPKKVEFIVYDVRLKDQPEGTIKADVEQFKSEHPDLQVQYVSHAYAEPPATGQIKRDITNVALSRLSTLPTDAEGSIIISDNGGNAVTPTYLANTISMFDAEPTMDMVVSENTISPEAYKQYPLIFAQRRAFDIFDSLVRHGESQSVPGGLSGTSAVRAGTFAGIGGYNNASPVAEDRELSWIIKTARSNTSDTIRSDSSLTQAIDPTEQAYSMLQHVGVADPNTPLSANETYKSLGWQELAQKATDTYTNEMFEADMNAFYNGVYPSLKATNPERFDAYFKRTMDALGVQYELKDGAVHLLDTSGLPTNMAAEIDLESFAKQAAGEVVAATPVAEVAAEPANPRDVLETMAGTSTEASGEVAGENPAPASETPTETVASSISSPDVGATTDTVQPSETPVTETQSKAAEVLPEGVEDRMNYVLNMSKEPTAAVNLTAGELMDYLKSHLELAGNTRITDGKVKIDGNTIKLTDMKAKSFLGEVHFDGTLKTDPSQGLVMDMSTVKYDLPLIMKLFEGNMKNQLGNFRESLLFHLSQRIPQTWQAERIDVVGEKIEVKFAKKT